MSPITSIAAAEPALAAAHFAARLAVETDAADVGVAVADGTLDATVVDVRSAEAFAAGHVRGAVHLPHADIDADRAAALPAGLLVVYCWGPGCNGAHRGAARLAGHGRTVKEMLGGWEYYAREGWPVATGTG
jgi:rhodanese-related sulfurtransferase